MSFSQGRAPGGRSAQVGGLYGYEKEYRALVEGEPDEATLKTWRRGVFLDGRRTAPAEVTVIGREKGQTWLRVLLREGRKRQIRRVGAMLGHPVHRLIRVRIGPLRLGDLKPGQWRRLTDTEVDALQSAGALWSAEAQPATRRRQRRSKRRG